MRTPFVSRLNYSFTKPDCMLPGIALASAMALCLATPVDAENHCDYKPGPTDAMVISTDETDKGIDSAWYGDATSLYRHGVLGDSIEAHTLYVKQADTDGCALEVTLDKQSVFEDVNPRIADVTGDGQNDIIVIESHVDHGASLAIYGIENGALQKIASTPFIGTPNRWLAPIGTADFNGDGIHDVAYVQTPHLAGVLKIWSFESKDPTQLFSKAGYSNHRIGQNYITGGINNCGDTPAMILPDISWSQLLKVTISNGAATNTVVSDETSLTAANAALLCK